MENQSLYWTIELIQKQLTQGVLINRWDINTGEEDD